MKGYIYHGPGNITLEELELAPCGDNDVIVKNIAAGVCGSDITAYKHGGETEIRIAKLGNDAGIIGAAFLGI